MTANQYPLPMMSLVPTEKGGVQIEWHRDGWDIEIEFDKDGTIIGVLVAREAEASKK